MTICFLLLASITNWGGMSRDQIISSHQNSEKKEDNDSVKAVTLDTCDDKAEQRDQSISTECQRRTEEGQWR